MRAITSDKAPAAMGPYSQAVDTGEAVFLSGQLGVDPESGALVEGGAAEQAKQAIANIEAVLKEAGLDLINVAKVTMFMDDLDDFEAVNAVYAECFGDHKPARSTIQVEALPLNALVEIECIAFE